MLHPLFPMNEAICSFVMMLVALLGYIELRYAERKTNRKAMVAISIMTLLELITIMNNSAYIVLGRILVSVTIFILSICIFCKLKGEAWSLQTQKWYCVIFWILAVCNGWLSFQWLTMYFA